jgi:hypothetical protein
MSEIINAGNCRFPLPDFTWTDRTKSQFIDLKKNLKKKENKMKKINKRN